MSHISSFRTPTMRAPKKRHKQEHEATVEELEAKLSTDNQGVGVIGEVTPGSRSTSGTPSVMRTNTTKRRELGLSSGPYTHFGQGSSNQAEGAQVDRVIGYGPREQAIPAGDSDDTPMQLQNPLLSADDQLGAFKEAAPLFVEGTRSEDTTTLRSAKKLYAKGNDQGLVVKDKEMRKTKASTIEEENKPKDEIKEEGSSKEAAKMLNRAIDLSDVTKAGAPESLSFSYRPERYDINTMTVEGGKAFTPSHEGEAKKSKTWRSTRLNILRSKQKCFEDNEISRVADTTKATHQLSAKAIEEHGTNKGRGYIQTIRSRRSHGGVCKGNADREKESKEIKRKLLPPGKACNISKNKDSQRAKLEADHAQGRDKVRGRHKQSVSESTDGYIPISHPNKNMPRALQMVASKRKHTGRSPEKNASLEERRCETALPESDDQMKRGKRVFPKRLKHPRPEPKSMTEKNHEDDSTGPTRLERFPSSIPAQSKARKQKANVYGSAVCNRNNGTLRHLQQGDFRHSSVGKSKIYSRRSNTEVKSSRNKRNGHTSKGSFRIIDKFGTAICILSCISDIENLDEMIEHKTCGLDDETIWYLTSKVKLKVRETINYIKTRD